MRLIYLSLAWVLGIYLGSKFEIHWSVTVTLLGISALLIIPFFRKRNFIWYGLCLVLLFGGILRFHFVSEGDELQNYQGKFCKIQGIIAVAPQVKDQTTVLHIEAKQVKVKDDGEWQDVSGVVQVYAPKFPGFTERDFPYYHYGDLIEFGGVPNPPESLQSETDFDFAEYLSRQGIYSVVYSPANVKLIESGQKNDQMEWIHHLRRSISASLEKALPEPQCALAQAMLLGERSSISPEVMDDFSRSGTSHLLAISGVHVGIVAGIALSAGIWIFGRRRPTYFLLALAVIWLYVVLSGMSPSAWRAATMGSLWLWADWLGRQRSAFTALAFAAAIMLAINPRIMSDVGFQLSFAAMAGLVFLTPIIQNWARKVFGNKEGEVSSTLRFFITSFAVTLGAVLATLPLVAYYFEYISLMSMPATLFTLPAGPGIIVTSALTGLAGIFAPGIADILGWLPWFFVTYVIEVVRLSAAIPFASIDVEAGAPAVYTYYGILIAALWIPKNSSRIKGLTAIMKAHFLKVPGFVSRIPTKWIVLPLVIATILVWTAAITALDSRLHVYVLDIGQGDAILIQKENQQILIDGGPGSEEIMEELGDRLPFWDRTIELVVLTHPDADHITGLIEVLQRYEVEKILTSGQEHDSNLYMEWDDLIEEKGIEQINARVGQQVIMADGIFLDVLHPSETPIEGTTSDLNTNSVVMRLKYENFSMLLTGDIEIEAEALLLKHDCRLKSTILKVAHHGSSSSTSPGFLAEVAPLIAVISAGEDNKFGHPTEEVLEKLEKAVGRESIYLTAEDGTIEFISDGEKLWAGTEN